MTRAPIGTFVLLAVAGVLYLGMMGSLSGLNETDAMGRGMALGFGAMFGVALWLVLAALLLVAALNGRLSDEAKVGASVLLPLSAIAASVAIDLYGAGASWALAVPLLVPLLIMAFVLWVRLPSLPSRLSPLTVTMGVGGLVAILTLLPLIASLATLLPNPARDARHAAREKAREEKLRQEEELALAREAEVFGQLGPDSPLSAYLQYLPGGDSRSHEALAGARRVRSRQQDAVALLNAGRIAALTDLFRLDLQITPELCAAYDRALTAAAAQISRARSDYLSVAIDLEEQLPNIGWLAGGRCNLDASLGALADHVRSVADSQRMRTFAAKLDGYRR